MVVRKGRYRLLGVRHATRLYCTTWETEPIFVKTLGGG